MNNLYEILNTNDSLGKRRQIISDYLSSHDITKFLPPGASLTADLTFPYREPEIARQSRELVFDYVVGNKYEADELPCDVDLTLFLIGIVQTHKEKMMLIVNPDGSIQALPRGY